jgi:alanine-alpha-ketoisovalerate/valine-pyruvate aminotransferase
MSRANLQVIESTWTAENDLIEWLRPQGGFTVFPRLRDRTDTRQLCERLGERGVLVVPGDCFGMPSHIRVGFGSQRERFAEDLAQLNEELNAYFAKRRLRSTVLRKAAAQGAEGHLNRRKSKAAHRGRERHERE